jgi:hypothetical protein
MSAVMNAIEMAGTVDEHRRLHLDDSLPVAGPARVKVIVLYPAHTDQDETGWLHAAARNTAFSYLSDPTEDVYTLADGKPIDDET